MATFYENLEATLQGKGITVNQFRKELEIPSPTICHWKDGAIPRTETISKIASYLKIPRYVLLNEVKTSGKTEKMIEKSQLRHEVSKYSSRELTHDIKRSKSDKVTEYYLEEVKEILNECNDRQRCEFMMFVYDFKDSMNKDPEE